MKTYFDCIPCFVRQVLDTARLMTDDEAIHEKLLREVLRLAGEMDLRQSPPAMSQQIHRLVKDATGLADPYREIKDECNQLALGLIDELESVVRKSDNPLATAIRLAIAGNIMDFGVESELSDEKVHRTIEECLSRPLCGMAVGEFAEAAARAKNILYLADNAGEIIFDRLLVEQLPMEKVTLAVRGMPIINDATMDDARTAGLTELVEVIDNGIDIPGTIIEKCSPAFRERFDAADMIISKGQGNYETLSDSDKDIFFILKAKCPVIAKNLDCEVGSMILRRKCKTDSREQREPRELEL